MQSVYQGIRLHSSVWIRSVSCLLESYLVANIFYQTVTIHPCITDPHTEFNSFPGKGTETRLSELVRITTFTNMSRVSMAKNRKPSFFDSKSFNCYAFFALVIVWWSTSFLRTMRSIEHLSSNEILPHMVQITKPSPKSNALIG